MRHLNLNRRRQGFSMLEILVTILIIGIIAIFVVPNYLDSLNKSKQKRTMADLHSLGRAMMSWLTDQMGAAAAGGLTVAVSDYGVEIDSTDLEQLLVPGYIADVPERDAWGHELDYYVRTEDLMGDRVMLLRSPGRDGTFSGGSYSLANFVSTDYAQDIVWADGIFIRWPVGLSASAP